MFKNDPFYRVLERTTSRFALLVEGDGASEGGGGNGAGGDAGSGGTPTAGPNWAQFENSLRSINEGTGALGGKLDSLIGAVRDASQGQGQAQETVEEVDLDGLTREQLVGHILVSVSRSFDDRLTEALTPLVNAINSIQTNTTTSSVQSDIKELKSSVKDFDDWKGDMAELSRQHASLNIPQLYALARGLNPTKVAELEKKYSPAPKPPAPKWGGLTNTGLPMTSEALKNAGATSGRDATREALVEVAQRHPVLAALVNS